MSFREPKHPIGSVAELFAGVGGFRLGLAKAGWKTVYSNQWEPSTKRQHASEVYVSHFGPEGHSNVDIALVDQIPENFDLLVGGFPCQDYSVANSLKSATGLEGKKGVLWWEILRLIVLHKPKFLFLENVDRLLGSPSARPGRDFAVMLSSLGRHGYAVEWRVINAADYGFPQKRKRVFLVAVKISNLPSRPEDVLNESGVLSRAFPFALSSGGCEVINLGTDPVAVSSEFNPTGRKSPFQHAGVFVDGRAFTQNGEAKYRGKKRVLQDVLLPDTEVPQEFWIDSLTIPEWEYLKGAKSILRTAKDSGFKYTYAEGAMKFPDALDKPSRTILTGEGGAGPSRFKHVIKTPGGLRRLTPIELERLSGFPDNWTSPSTLGNSISDGRRAFFVGNALVVGLVERVGKVLAFEISK